MASADAVFATSQRALALAQAARVGVSQASAAGWASVAAGYQLIIDNYGIRTDEALSLMEAGYRQIGADHGAAGQPYIDEADSLALLREAWESDITLTGQVIGVNGTQVTVAITGGTAVVTASGATVGNAALVYASTANASITPSTPPPSDTRTVHKYDLGTLTPATGWEGEPTGTTFLAPRINNGLTALATENQTGLVSPSVPMPLGIGRWQLDIYVVEDTFTAVGVRRYHLTATNAAGTITLRPNVDPYLLFGRNTLGNLGPFVVEATDATGVTIATVDIAGYDHGYLLSIIATPVASTTPLTPDNPPTAATPGNVYVATTNAFRDTIGVDTAINETSLSRCQTVLIPLLTNMGVYKIRTGGPNDSSSGGFLAKLGAVANAGIKIGSLTSDPRDGQSSPEDYVNNYLAATMPGTSLRVCDITEAVEGNNEWDVQPGLEWPPGSNIHWPSSTLTWQNRMYDAIKASSVPAIAAIKVGTPSLADAHNVTQITALGTVKADHNVMHYYQSGAEPDVDLEGMILPLTNQLGTNSGVTRNVVSTEGGWHRSASLSGQPGITELAARKYIVRFFATAWYHSLLHAPQTIKFFLFSLGIQDWSILLEHDNTTPTTASTALKDFITILSDPGAAFTPAPLNLTITGAPNDFQSFVLAKRSGKHYICMVRNLRSCSNYTTDITNSPVTVGVTIDSTRAGNIYRPSINGTTATSAGSHSTFNVSVNDDLTILELT